MHEAQRYGVPLSVAHQMQVEESGDPTTGAWGDAFAIGPVTAEGYRGLGVYQLYDKPENMAYLVRKYWTPYHRAPKGAPASCAMPFDVFNYLHNTELAMRYLADLHRRFGTWERALWYYQSGTVAGVNEKTKDYARRIVEAREPKMPGEVDRSGEKTKDGGR